MFPAKSLIARILQQAEELVLVFDYADARGMITTRVVSPFRFVGQDAFLGLCLTKEEPRRFAIAQCRNIKVDIASNYVMPVAPSDISARFALANAS